VKDRVWYGIVVVAYVAVAQFTQKFLTWTMGPIFFIALLEVLPRVLRRLRSYLARPSESPAEAEA
jgi:hypothetical protein